MDLTKKLVVWWFPWCKIFVIVKKKKKKGSKGMLIIVVLKLEKCLLVFPTVFHVIVVNQLGSFFLFISSSKMLSIFYFLIILWFYWNYCLLVSVFLYMKWATVDSVEVLGWGNIFKTVLALNTFQDCIMYLYSPSQLIISF